MRGLTKKRIEKLEKDVAAVLDAAEETRAMKIRRGVQVLPHGFFGIDDEARDQAYGLMADALAAGPKTGSVYEQVFIGEANRENRACVVQVGRLAMRVVDYWEAEPLTVEVTE